MLSSAMIEMVLGLALLFLLVSLLVSALNEMIASIRLTRAAHLDMGVRSLLAGDRAARTRSREDGLAERVLRHPLILRFGYPYRRLDAVLGRSRTTGARTDAAAEGTEAEKRGLGARARSLGSQARTRAAIAVRGKTVGPSYLPPSIFRLALLDELRRTVEGASGSSAPVRSDLLESNDVQDILDCGGVDEELRHVLAALWVNARKDVTNFERAIETWFTEGMERVRGWYRRATQRNLFFLGLGIAALFNLDAIHAGKELYRNPAMRAETVAMAEGYVARTGSDTTAAAAEVPAALTELYAAQQALPIGWPADAERFPRTEDGSPDWSAATLPALLLLAGWLVTAVAVTFGAPFWFDALQLFVNLRSAGTKPSSGKGDRDDSEEAYTASEPPRV